MNLDYTSYMIAQAALPNWGSDINTVLKYRNQQKGLVVFWMLQLFREHSLDIPPETIRLSNAYIHDNCNKQCIFCQSEATPY